VLLIIVPLLTACEPTGPERPFTSVWVEGTVHDTMGRPVPGTEVRIDLLSTDCVRPIGVAGSWVEENGRFTYRMKSYTVSTDCVVLTAIPPARSGLATVSDTFPDVRFTYTMSDTVRARFVLPPAP
jgi:hypothetical protein